VPTTPSPAPHAIPDDQAGSLPWSTILTWVGEGRRVVVPTADGAVVCLSEATYAELLAGTRPGADGPDTRGVPRLTLRERQILRAVREGGTGAEVADRMGLATNTVAQHLHAVRRKFGVGSTAQALAAAERDGLL